MQVNIIQSNNSHLTLEYLSKYGNGHTFVETGTYLGDTVQLAIDANFQHIHSTELDNDLCVAAAKLFEDKPQVNIWHGDSVDTLKDILNCIDGPATFWLDAHASGHLPGGKSGGSPVLDELRVIATHPCKEHTIFIDDRRLFGSNEWSGVKEQDALDILKTINPMYNFYYLNGHIPGDILCATVKKP